MFVLKCNINAKTYYSDIFAQTYYSGTSPMLPIILCSYKLVIRHPFPHLFTAGCLFMQKGYTALHIASLAGQEEIVRILVENGSKINAQSQVYKLYTTIHVTGTLTLRFI